MRILIIEDEENFASLLKKGLEREGYAVDCLGDGESGIRRILISRKDYDLIILDLMLPKKDGYQVCKEARAAGITLPILILTARDGLDDKVSLLDIGADDYLIKPFQISELLARLRALVRRPTVCLPAELSAQNIKLNPAEKTVFYGDKKIPTTLTEFRLLEFLMRNSGNTVERESLVYNVWDFNFDSFSNIVDVYINRLRKKLDKAGGKNLIETVRGVGYKIHA